MAKSKKREDDPIEFHITVPYCAISYLVLPAKFWLRHPEISPVAPLWPPKPGPRNPGNLREVSSKKWCVFVAGNFNLWKNPKILPLSYCGLVLRYLCAFRRNDCCLFFDWKQGQTKPIHLGYLADWKVWLMAPFGILLMWDADVPVQTVIHWPCGSV